MNAYYRKDYTQLRTIAKLLSQYNLAIYCFDNT